jgi:hypothetical protein
MATNSPGKLLRFWVRQVEKHEKGKKPADLPKKGQDQKLKIRNGLTALRNQAPGAAQDPARQPAFAATRDRLAKVLRNYCRYLKHAKDEDRIVLPRYLTAVKQLTVAVSQLRPGELDLGEDEGGLDEALGGLDVTALDAALERPEAEPEDSADFDTEAAPVPPPEGALALDNWRAAVADVTHQIHTLANAIVQSKDPNAAGAVKVLQAIVDHLRQPVETPAGAAAVAEYLQGDAVIAAAEQPNPYNVPVSIRARLLKALQPLRQAATH